jgi:transmembrane 9 superfamily protein 2/4
MLQPKSCQVLCSTKIPKEDVGFVMDQISMHYMVNWFVDGLPAGRNATSHYTMGFALGKSKLDPETGKEIISLHNHYDITILYHENEQHTKFRVVGVLVVPRSILPEKGQQDCSEDAKSFILERDQDNNVVYTYSVHFKPSKTPWGTRWDHYLYVSDENIHWFSVINSAVIVLLLSSMVSIILIRALHKDISRYNAIEPQEDLSEEFGWKLVHG